MEGPFDSGMESTDGIATTAIIVEAVHNLSFADSDADVKTNSRTDEDSPVPQSVDGFANFGQRKNGRSIVITLPSERLQIRNIQKWARSVVEIGIVAVSLLFAWCTVIAVTLFYAFPRVRL